MPESVRLSGKEIEASLRKANGWVRKGKEIHKEFVLKDFDTAIAFINRVAEKAQAADHHPDILLRHYKNVKITLTTHLVHALTQNDFDLAREIDAVVVKRKSSKSDGALAVSIKKQSGRS